MFVLSMCVVVSLPVCVAYECRRERASARRLFEPPSRPSFDPQFSQDLSAGLLDLQSRDESLEQASQSFVDAIPVIEPPDISDIWNDIDVSKPDVGNEKLDALSFDVKNKQQSKFLSI